MTRLHVTLQLSYLILTFHQEIQWNLCFCTTKIRDTFTCVSMYYGEMQRICSWSAQNHVHLLPDFPLIPLALYLYLISNECTYYRNWVEDWCLGNNSRNWMLRQMWGEKSYENSKNRRGNVFIIFQQSFWRFLLLIMNHGSLTQDFFGWGQEIRSGLTSRLSKIPGSRIF